MTEAALDVDEAVFDAVERIPAGRVSTYGAIGKLVGIGPRRGRQTNLIAPTLPAEWS